ncbi:hypothetical protein AAY473_029053 [Plecturocebus cupreus]
MFVLDPYKARDGVLLLSPRLGYNGMISAHCNLCLPDEVLLLSPRLECSGLISGHCNFCLLGSIEMRFHHVGQAGLKLLTSVDPPTYLASQSAGIIESHSVAQAMGQWLFTGTGTIVEHCSLELPGSRNPPPSASQVAGTRGAFHFTMLGEMWSFAILPRLVLNSWAQVILLLWLPKRVAQSTELQISSTTALKITLGGRGRRIICGQAFKTSLANMAQGGSDTINPTELLHPLLLNLCVFGARWVDRTVVQPIGGGDGCRLSLGGMLCCIITVLMRAGLQITNYCGKISGGQKPGRTQRTVISENARLLVQGSAGGKSKKYLCGKKREGQKEEERNGGEGRRKGRMCLCVLTGTGAVFEWIQGSRLWEDPESFLGPMREVGQAVHSTYTGESWLPHSSAETWKWGATLAASYSASLEAWEEETETFIGNTGKKH